MSKPWPRVKLGEVLSLDLDKTAIDPSQRYPMVGVLSFGRGLFDREPIDNGNTSYKYFLRLKRDHFVMSQLFGWEGALAVSSGQFSGKFVSPQFPTFVCDEKRLKLGFLGWCAKRKVFWDELGTRTNGMGDRRRTLNPAALFECEIPLPSIEEQRRIVARIDAVQQQLQQADTLRASIDHDIANLLAVRFQETLQHAEWLPMREVAPLVRREVTIHPEKMYSELGVRSFFKGAFARRIISGAEFTWQKLYEIKADDLIFSNIMAWEKGIALAEPEHDGCVGNHRMLTCEAKAGRLYSAYLSYYFTTEEGFSKIYAASPGTAARNRTLTADSLMDIVVPCPTISHQNAFSLLRQKLRNVMTYRRDSQIENEVILKSLIQNVLALVH